ncbi:MAG: DUF2207 domain-containing protein, partial [Actinomycetota bacterium]|nr:DUF2207 domain-containing protein [Actinomycetota bacterium]
MTRAAGVALACLCALALAPAAGAKLFNLPAADVEVRVEPDGALRIAERITFDFDGYFSGAFREIPLRGGESISDIAVSEESRRYLPGASAELGSAGAPGTFGVAMTGKGIRVVWHYSAVSERRMFTVRYRLAGLAVAYDDVVDVNLQVWGREWAVGLDRLTATERLPDKASGPSYRVWGAPEFVRGVVTRQPEQAELLALGVPAHQFVELRVLFPRSLLSSTAGVQVRHGNALPRIVAEEASSAASFERDRRRIHDAVHHIWRTLLILLALAFGPALAILAIVYVLFGRERATSYDREYEQEPPTDLSPALVPTLARQGGAAGSLEFTATLFDLIRRKRYEAKPVTTERKLWGGARHESVADLELSPGTADGLAPFEQDVAKVVDGVLESGSERLSSFRDRIAADRSTNSGRFTSFKQHVSKEVATRKWFESDGVKVLVAGIVVLGIAAAVLLLTGIVGFRAVAPRWSDVVMIALGGCAAVSAALLLFGALRVRLWRRRRPDAEAEAERWEAFRRYLTDFPRLQEAPPASLELWERYLVYGIAFGIAERVLQGAQLHMPEEVHQASSIYWISPSGD